jgi:rhamnulokinase
MLNQLIANTTGLPVMVGPIEASTIGNIIVQMMATGEIGSLEEGRAIVRSSFTCETYEPVGSKLWEEQYERYLGMIYGAKEGAGGRNVAG